MGLFSSMMLAASARLGMLAIGSAQQGAVVRAIPSEPFEPEPAMLLLLPQQLCTSGVAVRGRVIDPLVK